MQANEGKRPYCDSRMANAASAIQDVHSVEVTADTLFEAVAGGLSSQGLQNSEAKF
jgi:hypothetical protein